MLIIKDNIRIHELREMSKKMFGDLVKAVVDIEKEIMAVDGELHADEEQLLLANGSSQANLWGINIYPDMVGGDDFVEFDSMINIRPSIGNRSRGVEDPEVRERILNVVDNLITK